MPGFSDDFSSDSSPASSFFRGHLLVDDGTRRLFGADAQLLLDLQARHATTCPPPSVAGDTYSGVLLTCLFSFLLYYIDELIPSSKKFCSIYSPHQLCNISAYTIGHRRINRVMLIFILEAKVESERLMYR